MSFRICGFGAGAGAPVKQVSPEIRRLMGTGNTENNEEKRSMAARKKMICDLVEDALYVPMKEKELAVLLQVARE